MATKRGKASGAGAVAAEDASRALGIVLERMESQMRVVVEAVTTSRDSLREEMRALESRLSERIVILESVVRQNSSDIRKNSDDIRKNSDDIKTLREEVAGLRQDFDRRPELERMRALEERVARVEAKVASIP
ncbi:MAG: hypothetical protein JST00_18115 [Deltaproteobacteria bacterium]|nr:hypothetical protein [Deltaproteobacteria bacterium]